MRCLAFALCLGTTCPTLCYKNPQDKNANIYLEGGFYKDGFYKGREKNGMVEISEQNGEDLIWYQKGSYSPAYEDLILDPNKYAEIIHFLEKLRRYPGLCVGDYKPSILERIINIMGAPEMRHGFYEAVEFGIQKLATNITPRNLPSNENVRSAHAKIYLELQEAICQIFDLYPMSPRLFCAEVVKVIENAFIALCAAHMVGLDIMSTESDYAPPPQMVDAYYSLSPWKVYRQYFAGPYKDSLKGRFILIASLPPSQDFFVDWRSFLHFWGTVNIVEVVQRSAALLESDLKTQNPLERHLDPVNAKCLGAFTTKINEMMHQIEEYLICIFYLKKNPEEIRNFFIKGDVTLRINHQLSVHETLEINSILSRFEKYFQTGIGIIVKPSDSPKLYKHKALVESMFNYAENVMPADPVIYVSGAVLYLNEVHLKRKDPFSKRPTCCGVQ